MYDGSIKYVEDVNVGDEIMGDDSTRRTVLELCNNSDEMFKIIKKNKENYIVNKQHKLVLIDNKNIITEITIEDYIVKPYKWKNVNKIFRSSGVNFNHTMYDCYTPEFLYDIGFRLNCEDEEFIPPYYMINSRECRLHYLSGIIDSNVFYDKEKNNVSLCVLNKSFVDDLVFLLRSLGFSANIKNIKKVSKTTFTEVSCFLITIYGNINEIPCKLLNFDKDKILYKHLQDSFKIENMGIGEYYGFTLDGNHRFLLASFDIVRNTGKTTLISSILHEKKHIFPVGLVMSGTEDSNGFYRKIFPSTFVYNKYDEDKITSFIRRQKLAKQHISNPWAVILLDDCTDDPSVFRKPLQFSMYKNGRHWKMLYILSLQYCMDVKPAIRTNVDGTFILREPNLRNRRALYDNYAGIIPDFTLFCEILDALTDDFTSLYIHNCSTSNNWKDCIFYYKAKIIPENFKFGCPEFWEFHNTRYNPEYTESVI